MKTNHNNEFDTFALNISFYLNVEILQKIYVQKLLEANTNNDKHIISQHYNTLTNPIHRGDAILKIFNIKYSDIKIEQDFLFHISEMYENSAIDEVQTMYMTHEGKLNALHIIDKTNCTNFSILFLQYKYVLTLFNQMQ